MPRRKPIDAPVKKRGHLFDKLEPGKPPKGPMRKVMGTVLPPKMHRASKANGRWTPRKVGAPKGSKTTQPYTYSDELIIKALSRNGGLITYAAKAMGMDISALSLRIKNNPVLERARTEAREHYKDKAESVLDYHLDKKSLTAAIHITRYLCRDRGYVEKSDVEQVNGPVNLDAFTDEQLTQLVDAIEKKLEGKQG